ncbi:hypothetical protein ACFYWU_32595 [Streptomyces chrestomyceticus]|uniref:hypothetical protein n=1 Tax=Streptomyces chrestomyceticus TaxID=68185 RepID=UPI0036AC7AD6
MEATTDAGQPAEEMHYRLSPDGLHDIRVHKIAVVVPEGAVVLGVSSDCLGCEGPPGARMVRRAADQPTHASVAVRACSC